jgi:hypothetical protein
LSTLSKTAHMSSATLPSPGENIVVVRRSSGSSISRLRQLRSTVSYIVLSASKYRCVSSQTVSVSRPPSLDASPLVDGRISPPLASRMNVRVRPTS